VNRPRGKVFTANASGHAFGERAIFTKFHNDGSASGNIFKEKRNGHGDRGRSVVAIIILVPCATDRSTPVRIARYQGNQSVSRAPVSMVDKIASPSFDAAIASDGAAVSVSPDAAIASDGADMSAPLVESVDDNASISR